MSHYMEISVMLPILLTEITEIGRELVRWRKLDCASQSCSATSLLANDLAAIQAELTAASAQGWLRDVDVECGEVGELFRLCVHSWDESKCNAPPSAHELVVSFNFPNLGDLMNLTI